MHKESGHDRIQPSNIFYQYYRHCILRKMMFPIFFCRRMVRKRVFDIQNYIFCFRKDYSMLPGLFILHGLPVSDIWHPDIDMDN